jgi:hypothetical protein
MAYSSVFVGSKAFGRAASPHGQPMFPQPDRELNGCPMNVIHSMITLLPLLLTWSWAISEDLTSRSGPAVD